MKILALVIDFASRESSEKLTCQIAEGSHSHHTVEIVHVDNGNETPVQLSSRQKALGIKLLRLPENNGYSGGILGAIASQREQADAFWMLNCDLEVEADCLDKLVRILEQNPRAGAVGPRVLKGGTREVWGTRGVINVLLGTTAMKDWQRASPLPKWSYIPGSSILVRAKAYFEVGGIPDRYRMYYEETHLCVQLQKAGWELWAEPSAVAYHHVNSLKERIPARHFAYYFARNNLYFWKANFRIPWFIQLPRTLAVVSKELILPLRRAKNPRIFAERLGYVLAGLWDGFSFLKKKKTYFEKRFFR